MNNLPYLNVKERWQNTAFFKALSVLICFIALITNPYWAEAQTHTAQQNDISPLPNGIRGFVQSNVCDFPSTIIATIKDVSMRDWYKPLAYLDNHRIYILDVGEQQILKGHKQAQSCFIQWREPPYTHTRDMVGKTYLISYTPHRDGCSTIETGAQIQLDAELLAWAKQHTFANDRCDADSEGFEGNRRQ